MTIAVFNLLVWATGLFFYFLLLAQENRSIFNVVISIVYREIDRPSQLPGLVQGKLSFASSKRQKLVAEEPCRDRFLNLVMKQSKMLPYTGKVPSSPIHLCWPPQKFNPWSVSCIYWLYWGRCLMLHVQLCWRIFWMQTVIWPLTLS